MPRRPVRLGALSARARPAGADGWLTPLQLRAPHGLQWLQWLRDSALHSVMHGAHYQALQGTLGYARVR